MEGKNQWKLEKKKTEERKKDLNGGRKKRQMDVKTEGRKNRSRRKIRKFRKKRLEVRKSRMIQKNEIK